MKPVAIDLSFNACAFQYWSFVSDTRQSTEFTPDALDDTINGYHDRAAALQMSLLLLIMLTPCP